MTSAGTLFARLLAAAAREGVMKVLPVWADGGGVANASALAPGGHVLAAYPSSVVRARVADLGPGGLVPFLRQHLPPPSSARLPLVIVLLSYEAGRAATGHEGLFERARPVHAHAHDALPDVLVARYDGYLEGPSEGGPWTAVGDTTPLERALAELDDDRRGEAERLASHIITTLPDLADTSAPTTYFNGFERILAGIESGDYYQVNLARRLEAEIDSNIDNFQTNTATRESSESHSTLRSAMTLVAQRLHGALRATQPTAFGALMPIADDVWLISGSPECLLQWSSRERIAKSFPIKGTIARSNSHRDDEVLRGRLRGSAKDQAEHVMIVDLVRNDLGRVAVPGSVAVSSLLTELPLETVRHLVSEVRATLPDAHDLSDLIGAVFPGGSITGAPKIAAMRALDHNETFSRGFYCGSLGLIKGGDKATLSILIRTAVLSVHGLTYGTGGGLVADSSADQEFAETELKAAAINAAIASVRTPKKPVQSG